MIYRNCSVSVWFYLSKKYFTKSLQLSFSTAVLNHAIRDSFLKNNHLKTFKLQTKSYWITAKSSSLHQTPHSKTESKFPTSWKCLSFISGNRQSKYDAMNLKVHYIKNTLIPIRSELNVYCLKCTFYSLLAS